MGKRISLEELEEEVKREELEARREKAKRQAWDDNVTMATSILGTLVLVGGLAWEIYKNKDQ